MPSVLLTAYFRRISSTLFVGCAIGGVTMEKLSKTMIPFYAMMIVVLMLITYVPEICLYVPNLIMGK